MVSFIIPSYNSEKTIWRCLNSIICQKISCDYEIILVDDGSNDNTKEVVETFKNQKIKYYYNSNHGVSYSRNFGISKSIGEYIIFVDSDDAFVDDSLNLIISNINSNDDLYIFGDFFIENDKIIRENKYNSKIYFNKKILANPFKYKGTPWGKIFLKRIIVDNNLKFNEQLTYGEDQLFFTDYLYHSKTVKLISVTGYKYYLNKLSLSKQTNEMAFRRIRELQNVLANFKLNGINYKKYYYYVLFEKMHLYMCCLKNSINNIDLKSYKKEINKNFLKALFSINVGLKNKFKYILFIFNKRLYLKLLND